MEIKLTIDKKYIKIVQKSLNFIIAIREFDFDTIVNFFKPDKINRTAAINVLCDLTGYDSQIESFIPTLKSIRRKLSMDPIMDMRTTMVLMRDFELVARAGIGQFKSMIELLSPGIQQNELVAFEYMLKEFLFNLKDGFYLEITNSKVYACSKVSWYLYQLLRREYSWYAISKDWRTDQRDWNKMMGVSYDDPFPELKGITIERIEK